MSMFRKIVGIFATGILLFVCVIVSLELGKGCSARAQQGNPPLHTYLTPEQIESCTEWLTTYFVKDEIEWSEEWSERLCDPIGTLDCDDVEEIKKMYCEEEK